MYNLTANITSINLLYLFYGAAFLFLGVSIAAKDMKGSDLKLADNLWLLGTFGFSHGLREWLELGHLVENDKLSTHQVMVAEAVGALLTFISFVFLLQFGIVIVCKLYQKQARWLKVLPTPLFLAWIYYVSHHGIQVASPDAILLLLWRSELGARYLFGFTGSTLTAYGLIAYARELRILSPSVSKRLSFAGVAFIFYAIFTGIIPDRYILPIVYLPIELFRGVSACFITYFIAKALNIFDIEARIKIEQQSRLLVQAEKLTSLGQLAAGIAHEINNPLTNASLSVQTLKKYFRTESDRQDIVEKLDSVERNLDRASVIAQELLQFSHQREYDFVSVDILTVLHSTLTLLQYKLKPVTIIPNLVVVPNIMGNPGKLLQVFINILSNAVEAMPGGGKIFITTSLRGSTVIVEIRDTGKGISAENLSKVFDPFFTTKEIGSGTGLGLSICYGIIRQHNGTIDISSEGGNGTKVIIKLHAKEIV